MGDDDAVTVATTSGRPIADFELRIGDSGEVLLRGPNVMLGYLDDPAATAAAIDGDGWLHTGDIGELDDAGNHAPGGWFWRYDLAPNGDGTEVTLTYDWTATPQEFRDRVGSMPIFGEDYLAASLATLEETVTTT